MFPCILFQGEEVKQSQRFFLDLITEEKIKAFHEVALAPSLRGGIQTLLLVSTSVGGRRQPRLCAESSPLILLSPPRLLGWAR
jgi:hypothetical protein